jgi:phosphomannomutase
LIRTAVGDRYVLEHMRENRHRGKIVLTV